MMKPTPTTYNIHEAKTHLSRLLEQMESGEDIVIARAGVPVARLVPVVGSVKERALGTEAGRLIVADDFDAPMPDDLLDTFER
ncbi:MAG: type II toxin-antitoxin system prevent-host-death family antitoxin [Gemmatimonadaceae bacterium]|nr:type II toxin-antitoxin system prevent-host-death family antitoxin [Gemmatimonadaceae bacterium]